MRASSTRVKIDSILGVLVIKITEKRIFRIPPCKLDKELINKIADLLQDFNPHYLLTSSVKDIECDDATLFTGTDWPPSHISAINISVRESSRSVDISINPKEESQSKVQVLGEDAIWVNGVADKLYSIFKSKQVSYYRFVNYWPLRIILSVFIVFLVLWILNHRFWPLTSQFVKGFSETSFLALLSLICVWFAYPVNKLLARLFPRFEFENSVEGKIRKILWAIVIFLVGWVISEIVLPWLVA